MREIRTLRAMWRGLETTHGSDTEALSTETESKQSRPNLRSIGASPRPYRAPESDGHRLSRCNSNQMHVQPIPHLFFALFTAKIYQLLMADSSQLVTCCVLSCRPLQNFLQAAKGLASDLVQRGAFRPA